MPVYSQHVCSDRKEKRLSGKLGVCYCYQSEGVRQRGDVGDVRLSLVPGQLFASCREKHIWFASYYVFFFSTRDLQSLCASRNWAAHLLESNNGNVHS